MTTCNLANQLQPPAVYINIRPQPPYNEIKNYPYTRQLSLLFSSFLCGKVFVILHFASTLIKQHPLYTTLYPHAHHTYHPRYLIAFLIYAVSSTFLTSPSSSNSLSTTFGFHGGSYLYAESENSNQ